MRFPLLRFRLRTFAAIIAITALILGLETTRRRLSARADFYRGMALDFQAKAEDAEISAWAARYNSRLGNPQSAIFAADALKYKKSADRYRALVDKYRYASQHPWATVSQKTADTD